MIWMEKIIGEHLAEQPEIIKFAELDDYIDQTIKFVNEMNNASK